MVATTTHATSERTGYPAPARSFAHMFLDRVERSGDEEAFRYPDGDRWTSLTWRELADEVEVSAAGLLALGLQAEERVAIISSTRIEWVCADLAIACSGGATTTVYATTAADDAIFILADSESRIAFVETEAHVAMLRAARDRLPDLRAVITFDGGLTDTGGASGDWVLSIDALRSLGASYQAAHPSAVADAVDAIEPERLATLIYTSGTTGRPKGVELPHRCWTYVGAAAEALGLLSTEDVQYLWLPLAHSFGKMLEAVQLQLGFVTAIDGRIDKVAENLALVRPTFMAGPPRIFEKLHAAVLQSGEEAGALRAPVFRWAFGVGTQIVEARLAGHTPSLPLRLQHAIADQLVFAKIRARLGGRIRFLLSGSAPLSKDIVIWFHAAGITVTEGYGLTETSAAASVAPPDRCVPGTVGPAIPGTELALSADGEVLVRGPGVMRGYHHQPEATAEVLDADGWLATGDVGELDSAGYLRITDRKKDLIKTSGGKYIAPQVIEVLFKAICPLASQMLVYGNGRKYATALISLDLSALTQWALARGMEVADQAELVAAPAVRDYVHRCVSELNDRLNRWETIKDFRILDHDLTVQEGLLTPNLKLKRKLAEMRFSAQLESMYSTSE